MVSNKKRVPMPITSLIRRREIIIGSAIRNLWFEYLNLDIVTRYAA